MINNSVALLCEKKRTEDINRKIEIRSTNQKPTRNDT